MQPALNRTQREAAQQRIRTRMAAAGGNGNGSRLSSQIAFEAQTSPFRTPSLTTPIEPNRLGASEEPTSNLTVDTPYRANSTSSLASVDKSTPGTLSDPSRASQGTTDQHPGPNQTPHNPRRERLIHDRTT